MYIIIYDFGTSSVKTCLFNIDSEIHIVANSTADYGTRQKTEKRRQLTCGSFTKSPSEPLTSMDRSS